MVHTNYQQDDWKEFLPLAEFTYNNQHHSSIDTTPFFTTYGYHPTLLSNPTKSQLPSVQALIGQLRRAQQEAKAAIKLAQERQAYGYDKGRMEIEGFKIGQE